MPISERLSVLVLLLGALLAAPAGAATLKIATLAPEGSIWMQAMREAAAEVEAGTEGRVKIKFYPGGVMGHDSAVLKKIRLGQLQGGAFAASELAGVAPDAQILGLPFLLDGEAQVRVAREAVLPAIEARLEEGGLHLLSLTGVGFAYLMSTADLSSPKALAARRVWVPQGDSIAERTFREGGITPIPLPLGDVFTALQSGLVDTVGNTPAGAIALQWHGRLRQLLDHPLSYVVGYVVLDARAHARIDAADRAHLRDAFLRAGERIEASNRKADRQALEALEALGVERVPVDPAELARWKAIGRRVADRLVEEGVLDGALLARLRKALADHGG
ncbi:MAG: hypothetical protein KatS3mg126_2245 [Lysobacteraceae bacterium]|nr:MAG: hypothetical protein KatS3mg126_2245 [Xanthomonadaceae bacterium]